MTNRLINTDIPHLEPITELAHHHQTLTQQISDQFPYRILLRYARLLRVTFSSDHHIIQRNPVIKPISKNLIDFILKTHKT
ncbi:hypothetical protein STSO111631_09595 [Stackebrandtia soli]